MTRHLHALSSPCTLGEDEREKTKLKIKLYSIAQKLATARSCRTAVAIDAGLERMVTVIARGPENVSGYWPRENDTRHIQELNEFQLSCAASFFSIKNHSVEIHLIFQLSLQNAFANFENKDSKYDMKSLKKCFQKNFNLKNHLSMTFFRHRR